MFSNLLCSNMLRSFVDVNVLTSLYMHFLIMEEKGDLMAFQNSHFLLSFAWVVERKSQQYLILGSINICQVILIQLSNSTYSYVRLFNHLYFSFDALWRNKTEKINFSLWINWDCSEGQWAKHFLSYMKSQRRGKISQGIQWA